MSQSYILVLLVDRVGNGNPVIWYPLQGKCISIMCETQTDALTFARALGRILGVQHIYVEAPEGNYLLKSDWIRCDGIKAPDRSNPAHPLDVIGKAQA